MDDEILKVYIKKVISDQMEQVRNDLLFNEVVPLRDEVAKLSSLVVKTRLQYLVERLLNFLPKKTRPPIQLLMQEMCSFASGCLASGEDPFLVYMNTITQARERLAKQLPTVDLDFYFPAIDPGLSGD